MLTVPVAGGVWSVVGGAVVLVNGMNAPLWLNVVAQARECPGR